MSTAPKHDGVWERRAAAAVKAVYADADLRLEALQLDLLEPRPDGTRWTAQQVKDRRTVQAVTALRGSAREFGRSLAEAMERIAEVVRPINRALIEAYVNAAPRAFAAAFTTTRGNYSLAADQGDPQ